MSDKMPRGWLKVACHRIFKLSAIPKYLMYSLYGSFIPNPPLPKKQKSQHSSIPNFYLIFFESIESLCISFSLSLSLSPSLLSYYIDKDSSPLTHQNGPHSSGSAAGASSDSEAPRLLALRRPWLPRCPKGRLWSLGLRFLGFAI